MQNTILIAALFSLIFLYGCPSTDDSFNDDTSYMEKNVFQEESFEENSDIEEEQHHIENKADIAGDLIF